MLKNIGLRAAGGNYKTVQKYITEYGIDSSHFNGPGIRLEKLINFRQGRQTPLEEVMIEKSTYNRGHLKTRLYKLGLKKRSCEECGQGEEWQGKRMSLILDHINGVHDDNRLENLRILCPNCNATLDTHCGKNKSAKNNLVQGPKERKIFLEKRKVERPDLAVVKQEVKGMGYCAVGRKYGVSDNAIRKWLNN